jgi:oligopeptide transport system substrate-binding protein
MEPGNIITNGAYYYSGWVHDGYIEVPKNAKSYAADTITVDKITFHISGDETSILAAYQAGDYDWLGTVSADQIESLQASGDLFINPTLSMTYCYINTEKMPDWRVRAALMLAIDRENICDNVRQDGSLPAIGLISSAFVTSDNTGWADYTGAPMYNWLAEKYPEADLESYIGRCELAQELYAEAVAEGWDESTTMTYWYNSNDVNKAIGEAIQSDITNVLGINMVLETCDSATYCDTISKGDYYLARLGQGGDFNDPFYYFTCFGTNGDWEYSGWSNAEWDEMYKTVQTLEVGEERDALLAEMEQFMFTEEGFSVAPLYYGVKTYCAKSDLQNMMFYPINGRTFFGYVTR